MRVVYAVNIALNTPPDQQARLASTRYRGIIPASQLQRDGHQARTVPLMELFRPDFDTRLDLLVLHQPKHDILMLANVIGVLFEQLEAIRRQGGRTVVDVSDFKLSDEFRAAANKAFGPEKAQSYRTILDGLFARCDAVTAPTGALAQQMRDALKNAKPVFVIEDVVEVSPQPARFSPGAELKLLWFGFLSAHVAALRQLVHEDLPKLRAQRPTRLTLVCEALPSPDSQKVFGAGGPAAFGIAHEVWSLPALEAALADCDLVVLPFATDAASSKGKSNNRALQALAAGRYVVAHPLESYQTLGDYIGLNASIAEGVEAALRDPAVTLARLQAGQDFVQARYSPAANAARWLAVLGELTA